MLEIQTKQTSIGWYSNDVRRIHFHNILFSFVCLIFRCLPGLHGAKRLNQARNLGLARRSTKLVAENLIGSLMHTERLQLSSESVYHSFKLNYKKMP